jgi:glycosyltransferase XagB
LEIGTYIITLYIIVQTGFFLTYDFLLGWLMIRFAVKNPKPVDLSNIQIDGMPESKLPTITILLPVHNEKATLPQLIKKIVESDYPRSKLDIRFLVEHEDINTLKSIIAIPDMAGQVDGVSYNRYGIPTEIRVWKGVRVQIHCLHSSLKTKPNALNYGLSRAKGSIIAVYDAEDSPDPRQLRMVATYFIKNPGAACVQARLAYYNSHQSILTKFFAIEYMQQFLLNHPAYYSMKCILPLGGTSNFFRTEVLRDLGGWDPTNVTEDVELGIRLQMKGHSIIPINSITWEEAPPRLYTWLKQRSRWNKGYLYTLLVHFRNPVKITRALGFKSTIYLFFMLIAPLVNAAAFISWIMVIVYWLDWSSLISLQPLAGWIQDAYTYHPVLFYSALITFGFGFAYNIFGAFETLFRQDNTYSLNKVRYSLFVPIYHFFHAIACFMALYGLIVKPTAWDKTPHGFSIKEQKMK